MLFVDQNQKSIDEMVMDEMSWIGGNLDGMIEIDEYIRNKLAPAFKPTHCIRNGHFLYVFTCCPTSKWVSVS